jgi:hypothetical protein
LVDGISESPVSNIPGAAELSSNYIVIGNGEDESSTSSTVSGNCPPPPLPEAPPPPRLLTPIPSSVPVSANLAPIGTPRSKLPRRLRPPLPLPEPFLKLPDSTILRSTLPRLPTLEPAFEFLLLRASIGDTEVSRPLPLGIWSKATVGEPNDDDKDGGGTEGYDNPLDAGGYPIPISKAIELTDILEGGVVKFVDTLTKLVGLTYDGGEEEEGAGEKG